MISVRLHEDDVKIGNEFNSKVIVKYGKLQVVLGEKMIRAVTQHMASKKFNEKN